MLQEDGLNRMLQQRQVGETEHSSIMWAEFTNLFNSENYLPRLDQWDFPLHSSILFISSRLLDGLWDLNASTKSSNFTDLICEDAKQREIKICLLFFKGVTLRQKEYEHASNEMCAWKDGDENVSKSFSMFYLLVIAVDEVVNVYFSYRHECPLSTGICDVSRREVFAHFGQVVVFKCVDGLHCHISSTN